MIRLALIGLLPTLLAAPALAQPADPHAGHAMPAPDPHAGHGMPAPDPHAGHAMPPAPVAADPHAGHSMPAPDPHAGHDMSAMAPPVGAAPPPPPPMDHAADRIFGADRMAAARAQMTREHGDVRYSKVMLETAEYRPSSDGDAYAWEGQASFGGDVHRVVVKSEGEGEVDHGLEAAEVQALYSRAVSPYFNLQAGLRQDFEPDPRRTYATLGIEGLAPYWFEVGGALFLSHKGDVSARLEGSYDLRLTQRLILEPTAELNLAAQHVPELRVGSGVSDIELGLRLRYAIRPEFAPYVGVVHERKFGRTADYARADGGEVRDNRFVVGLRAWF